MEVVVLGCRKFGRVHLRALSALKVQFSVMERDPRVREECSSLFHPIKTFSSVEEALSSDADVVDVVLPHNLHREVTVAALKKGKHVLVEKPIATTLEEGEEMIRTAKESKMKLMVGEQYFFDPTIRAVTSMISQGKLGKVHSIIVRDQRYYDHVGWRTEPSIMGGGALIDGGIHYVDTMLNLGGDYDQVTASVSHVGSTLKGEDNTMALFRFKSGATGFLFYSWAYRGNPSVPGFEVVGSEGTVYEDVTTRSQADFVDPSRTTAYGLPVLNGRRMEVERYDVFQEEIGSFLRAIERDEPVPFPPELALRDLRAVLQIYGRI